MPKQRIERKHRAIPSNVSSSKPSAAKRQRHRTPSLVHWFRKGLRLHDNPTLKESLKGVVNVRCIYILDPWFAGAGDKGVNRWRFLLQCLEDLDASLRKLNSRLFVVRGQPADVLPKLFKEWRVTRLSFDEDSEPFGRERDQAIQLLAKDAKVEVVTRLSHTLYDPLDIQHRNNNEPPMTYKRFLSIVASMPKPPKPIDPISSSDLAGITTVIGPNHSEKYGIPTLEELGFEVETIPPAVWIGGETEAKQRLDRHLERKAWVANFERPKMSPASLMASSTGLGAYLKFGCLSPRVFYWRLTELYLMVKKRTEIPISLHGQLLWREFFFAVACNNPNFDTMADNPMCVQIPWTKNQHALDRWTEGKTGYPWIDAIMTQLRLEGWIHPLARHAVSCFLTRGDLWINWEEGMKVFDEYLLEADWSVNAGNWIWLSCSSFYQHFFHCYDPVKFGKRTDPSGDFIRKYLPVLKNFPKEFIFEPWTAPLALQEESKCILGKDYPLPMVNHAEASHANLQKMKKVYQEASKYIGPGLLAVLPSSQKDSGPVPENTKPMITVTTHQDTYNASSYRTSQRRSQGITPISHAPKTLRYSPITAPPSRDLRKSQQQPLRMPIITSHLPSPMMLDTPHTTTSMASTPKMYSAETYPKYSSQSTPPGSPLYSTSPMALDMLQSNKTSSLPPEMYLPNGVAKYMMSITPPGSPPYSTTVPSMGYDLPPPPLYASGLDSNTNVSVPNMPRPVYATASMGGVDLPITTCTPALSYSNYTNASLGGTGGRVSSSHPSYMQQQQQHCIPSLSPELRTPPNYMVTGTGDMVIPSYTDRPPLHGCTYTDTLFAPTNASKLDTSLRAGTDSPNRLPMHTYTMETAFTL